VLKRQAAQIAAIEPAMVRVSIGGSPSVDRRADLDDVEGSIRQRPELRFGRNGMLKWIGVGAAALMATGAAAQETLLERGSYLVNAVMACDGCHTPRGPAGFDMSRRFSGGAQVWDEPAYLVRGSNISSDRETGIGGWSANDLKRMMVDGMRPNGVPVAPQMPYAFYKILTPRDLDAVVAYTLSVPAVRNQVPAPVYRGPMHAELIPGAEKPFSEDMLKDTVKRGFYLGTIAHCMECHSRRPDGKADYVKWNGKGGYVFKSPKGSATTKNISSHKTAGVGAWTDAELKRSLTHGVDRSGRPFALQMQRQMYFSKMTDADLNAIVAWVRTIPPIE
jgi:mono/diheme cytochrome c family protein